MFQVSFVLAALLVAEGVVLAHPINYVHRNEPPSIVPRAVPDNDQAVTFTRRSLLEDLYKEIVDDMMESHTLHGKKDPHEEFSATVTTHGDKQSWLGIRGYDIGDVVTRGLSGLEDLETRGYWGDEETSKSRESDNGWMGPTARESDGGELNARDFE
ncbi:hypothetical protein AX14_001054 [Amanita brunnescens Koide BX004]|nr:hypothetical protein AX14_001054 [Amanita brunnescens Koide BX004]